MKTLSVLTAFGLVMSAAVPATATTNLRLQFFSDDTGGILWQTERLDSPLDPNKARIMVTVLSQDGDDFAGAFANGTGIEGKLVGVVRNLSFDFLNDSTQPVHIGAGSPRYSVLIDTDGNGTGDTAAFMAAFHCQTVLPENPAWSRADFTGRTLAGCSLFVGAEQFTSDGAKSAWRLMADAHPTWKVTSAFFIVDEVGTTFVDRLAFHNKAFIAGGDPKTCPNESSC